MGISQSTQSIDTDYEYDSDQNKPDLLVEDDLVVVVQENSITRQPELLSIKKLSKQKSASELINNAYLQHKNHIDSAIKKFANQNEDKNDFHINFHTSPEQQNNTVCINQTNIKCDAPKWAQLKYIEDKSEEKRRYTTIPKWAWENYRTSNL
jgi:hypothetical protein